MAHLMKNETNMLTYKHDCISQHLIGAKIQNFEGDPDEMELVAYLVSTARALTTLAVFFKSGLPADVAMALTETIKSFSSPTKWAGVQFGHYL